MAHSCSTHSGGFARTRSADVRDLRSRFDFFHQLSEDKMLALAAAMIPRRLGAGEILFRQGECDGGSCFFLTAGVVSMYCKNDAQTALLARRAEEEREHGETAELQRPVVSRAQDAPAASEAAATNANRKESVASDDAAEAQDKPAHRRSSLKALGGRTLGGTRRYVGVYVQERDIPDSELMKMSEDHGAFQYRRKPGGTVGALSALTGCPRQETAIAEVDSVMLEIKSEEFRELMATNHEKNHAADVLFLREVPCFRRLPDSVLVKFAASFQCVTRQSRVDVCRQGTTPIAMHIIRRGQCELVRNVKMPRPELGRAVENVVEKLRVADLARTDMIGHYEILANTLHSFSISTTTDAELWTLTVEGLDAVIHHFAKEFSECMKNLKTSLLEHGRRAEEFHRHRARDIGSAKWGSHEQIKTSHLSSTRQQQTSQKRHTDDVAAALQQVQLAGNFCSATELGSTLVSRLMEQRVYSRKLELQPRIHPMIEQPLKHTNKELAHVLNRRHQSFNAPVPLDLTAGVPFMPDWADRMEYMEPFEGVKMSKRDLLIHDRLSQAVNMFEAYASLAEVRLRASGHFRRSPSPKRVRTSKKAATSENVTAQKSAQPVHTDSSQESAMQRAKWLDLQGFLSLLEGADILKRPDKIFEMTPEEILPQIPPEAARSRVLFERERADRLSSADPQLGSAQPVTLRNSIEIQVKEKSAIRIFLAEARRLRTASNNPLSGVPERSISFDHFLGCLRTICADLDCPALPRLQNAERALSTTPDMNTSVRAYTSLSLHSDEEKQFRENGSDEKMWKSPMILRQEMEHHQRSKSTMAAYRVQASRAEGSRVSPRRHQNVKLKRIHQPPTPVLPYRSQHADSSLKRPTFEGTEDSQEGDGMLLPTVQQDPDSIANPSTISLEGVMCTQSRSSEQLKHASSRDSSELQTPKDRVLPPGGSALSLFAEKGKIPHLSQFAQSAGFRPAKIGRMPLKTRKRPDQVTADMIKREPAREVISHGGTQRFWTPALHSPLRRPQSEARSVGKQGAVKSRLRSLSSRESDGPEQVREDSPLVKQILAENSKAAPAHPRADLAPKMHVLLPPTDGPLQIQAATVHDHATVPTSWLPSAAPGSPIFENKTDDPFVDEK